MSDYDVNLDDEWSDEELLGSLGETFVNDEVDDDCEVWGFSLLNEDGEAHRAA